ncbi:MAG: hypothetical protein P3T54_00175 [Dehalogenimonas sp.]|nr:hypothetical protein [Dehalogenimonas sp.]
MTLQKLAYDIVDATITVGTHDTGAFPVTIQLKNAQGGDLNHSRAVAFYLSKDSDGSSIAADTTDTTEIAILTDGLLVENVTDISGWLISEADGDIGLTITVADGKTAYLVLIMPDGQLVISDVMTWAS